jgi:16S rRNA (guanine527-N7)-methyltransferase
MTSSEPRPLSRSLIDALHRSRDWGFLGDGPLDVHISHARGFAAVLHRDEVSSGSCSAEEAADGPWLDLGSGGGIPGLVLANEWPHRRAVLLDSNERRAQFLTQVLETEGWQQRAEVETARAEEAGRRESLRGAFSLVVARSFGSPSVTAECGAPFLCRGGVLIVSEPPVDTTTDDQSDARWPAEPLAELGLERVGLFRSTFGYQVLRQVKQCPDRFPRRVGVPGKRPLYRVGGGEPLSGS